MITAASKKSPLVGGRYSCLSTIVAITDGIVANIVISPDTLDVLNKNLPNFELTRPAFSALARIGPATLPATAPPAYTNAPNAKSFPQTFLEVSLKIISQKPSNVSASF